MGKPPRLAAELAPDDETWVIAVVDDFAPEPVVLDREADMLACDHRVLLFADDLTARPASSPPEYL
jgi:hypothetical protein